jgi:hypothetical protein
MNCRICGRTVSSDRSPEMVERAVRSEHPKGPRTSQLTIWKIYISVERRQILSWQKCVVITCSVRVSFPPPHSRTLFPTTTHSEWKWSGLKITSIKVIVNLLVGSLPKESRVRLVAADSELGSQWPYFEWRPCWD